MTGPMILGHPHHETCSAAPNSPPGFLRPGLDPVSMNSCQTLCAFIQETDLLS
jgi:hypothetical protein